MKSSKLHVFKSANSADIEYVIWGVPPGGRELLNRKLFKGAKLSEIVLSRFEKGKPADPTKNMSSEDAKKWWDEHEKNKDNFKSASEEIVLTRQAKDQGHAITIVSVPPREEDTIPVPLDVSRELIGEQKRIFSLVKEHNIIEGK